MAASPPMPAHRAYHSKHFIVGAIACVNARFRRPPQNGFHPGHKFVTAEQQFYPRGW
jgi:hypothetical protein